MPIFADTAQEYVQRGYSPLPIIAAQKRPAITGWQIFCSRIADEDELKDWLSRYPNHNIGVALGQQIGDYRFVAIDIDADDLVERVRRSFPVPPTVAKRGKKGVTYFVRAYPGIKNEKIKRMVDGRVEAKPSVEILAHGSQTVVPPSIHPDTKRPYEWLGSSLFDVEFDDLPILTEAVLDEIKAQVSGHGKYFDDLNTMVWLGVGGGGNTHDVCVGAVASMVNRGWADADIRERIIRAKKEACQRSGKEYDWPQAEHAIDEWIKSAREKGMTGASKATKPSLEQEASLWAIQRLGGLETIVCLDGLLREYRNGHWPQIDMDVLHADLATFDPRIKDRDVRGAVNLIMKMAGVNPAFKNANHDKTGRICLLNGTINIKTGHLERHDPSHALLHQVPIEWDDKAQCPTYDRFIRQTFGDDEAAINLWDEFAALTFVDDISFQKILFLQGVGANGKSTLASLLRSIHDQHAVASESITELDHEYHRATLVGKLVSIASEQSRLNQVSDRYLKAITGGDPVTIRQPYKQVATATLTVRFIQIVNDMPRTADLGHALQRRLIILSCPNIVPEDRQDKHLMEKLLGERPGIIRRWSQALRRLYKRRRFDIPESSQQAVKEYIKENDPVAMWLEVRTEPDGNGDSASNLYADFTAWEKVNNFGSRPTSSIMWGKRMTELGFPTASKRVGRDFVRMKNVKIKPGMEGKI